MKINQIVRDKVSSILSDGKVLLRLALDSLIESIRNDPVKYSSLFLCNNIPPTTTNSSYMYGEQQQYLPSQDYFIEHYTAMLLHEAEKFYNKLVKDLTNRVVCDMAFNNSSQSSSLLSYSTDGMRTRVDKN